MRPVLSVAKIAALALTLTACPDLPEGGRDFDTPDSGGAEVFVPLSLVRVDASVGAPAGGDRVTLRGAGLGAGARVRFGARSATDPILLDSGRLNVTTPPNGAGLVDVHVELPDGQTATLAGGFLYTRGLRLDAIEPDAGPVAGGTPVTLTGAAFTDRSVVLIGGRPLVAARRVDEATITGLTPTLPASRAGLAQVSVWDGLEFAALDDAFTFLAPVSLSGLSPVAGPADGGARVRLTGEGLAAACAVRFGGTPAEVLDFDDAESPPALEVRAPPGPPREVVDVSVDCDGAEASLPRAWRFLAPSEGLAVVHVVPASGPVEGGVPVSLAVTGLALGESIEVRFDGNLARILDVAHGAGFVRVEAPAASAAGEVAVTVAQGSRGGGGGRFAYVDPPRVASLAPAEGGTDGGTRVTIRGTGLEGVARLEVGGAEANAVAVEGDALTFRTPPGPSGKVDVTLRLTDGGAVTLRDAFEYRAGSSRTLGFSPARGAQAGGRVVRIHGRGFRASAPEVRFDAAPGTEVLVLDDSLAVVRLPAGDPGRVTVASGSETFAMGFAYFDPTRPAGGVGAGRIDAALNVTVLDRITGKAVPNAFVILWDDLLTPHQGLTDARGQLTFSDIGFGPPQMVTAAHETYTTASVVDFDGRDATLILFPLIPSEPGDGEPPEPPPGRADTIISGRVSGLDKYVVTPPGSCEARLGTAPSPLCRPCGTDADCGGGAARCTVVGDEGPRCTTGCTTDADCPDSFRCAGVSSFGVPAVQCVPDAGERVARCELTLADVFSPGPAPQAVVDASLNYRVQAPPGEYAVVCTGGVVDRASGVFTPLIMGARRNVFGMPGVEVTGQDVTLDIPLTRDLRLRLDGAPTGYDLTALHQADVHLDFGAEGVHRFSQRASGRDTNVFELRHFPAAFEESLLGATFAVYAQAIADAPPEAQTGQGSFVLQDRVGQVFSEALFELSVAPSVTPPGVEAPVDLGLVRRVPPGVPLAGLHTSQGAPGRVWATGEDGLVMVFDGDVWGRQQVPGPDTIRAVAARSAEDAWAVGDAGTIARWDGLRWTRPALPAALARADLAWDGALVEGPDTLLLWGNRGLWRLDTTTLAATQLREVAPEGQIRDAAQDAAGRVWFVGAGGLIRALEPDGTVATHDVPGADLNAVAVVGTNLAWAVGDAGRTLRWDGRVWFELLPIGTRALHAVAFLDADTGVAAGDSGWLWRWDGVRWRVRQQVEHQDLRGLALTPGGPLPRLFAAGLPTLVVGPFMQLAFPLNPRPDGQLTGLDLRWQSDRGEAPSFQWLTLNHPAPFTFWDIMASGRRDGVTLPDLGAAWGLTPLWPGEDRFAQMVRVLMPGFDMGAWDSSLYNPRIWRAWSVTSWPLVIPEP